jgi:hypothetical protein
LQDNEHTPDLALWYQPNPVITHIISIKVSAAVCLAGLQLFQLYRFNNHLIKKDTYVNTSCQYSFT